MKQTHTKDHLSVDSGSDLSPPSCSHNVEVSVKKDKK